MGVTIGIPHPDDWERANNEAIRSAIENTGLRPVVGDRRSTQGGIIVQVIDAKVAVTTTSTSSTSGTGTPGPASTKYLWPGKFAYRNINSLTDATWWYLREDCWIQEIDNNDLTVNQKYPGSIIGMYRGRPIVAVSIPSVTSNPASCSCCCCCVPCLTGLWLNIGQFSLAGCGLPADMQGFIFPLAVDGNCYSGSVTQANPGGYGDGTVTATAKICCDPNDKRHCPLLTVTGVTTILTGEFAGTYNWCIGPIDFAIPNGSFCIQTDQTVDGEGTTPAHTWQAVIDTAAWSCDPNGRDCGDCYTNPGVGESITAICMCGGFCPVTGIPASLPIVVTCHGVSLSVNETFTLTYYPSTTAAGSPCTVTGGTYNQPCWYGESEADADGCHMFFLLACMPDGTFSFCFGTVADPGGNCSDGTSKMGDILNQCHFADMTFAVCCNPFGMTGKYSGTTLVVIGNPTC